MIETEGILKARRKPLSVTFKIILLLIMGCVAFSMLPSQGVFAQDSYDIYYDNVDQWLIMAYTENNASSGKYDVYLEVMDTNGNLVPHENIKGLNANPYLIAGNAKNPMVCLAFDSSTGTAYIEYETDSGLVPPVSVSEIVLFVPKYSLSGAVWTSTGVGISSVTISLTGKSTGSTTTNTSGSYSFADLTNGSYTVTPSKTGCTFSPTNITVSINGANVTGQDFTGNCPVTTTYTISGKVTTSRGVAISKATMTLSGAKSATTTTDSGGNYSFTGLANGSYTVQVTKTGFLFNPSSKAATISGSNVTLNFNSYYP